LISQSTILHPNFRATAGELFPAVVKRCYDRASKLQSKFSELISELDLDLPKESCICLSGSVSRLESVQDSDIDYVLIWNDLSPHKNNDDLEGDRAKAKYAVQKINLTLAKNALRPCDSFSSFKSLSELTMTENLFSRYSIISLIDSSFIGGDKQTYTNVLAQIEKKLGDYAIGITPEIQVMRTLLWYISREGWIDQLHLGTSVNRFSRLIQLFATILSINQFGIDSTRATKTTWIRIKRLEPYLPKDTTACLKTLWTKALELKENRSIRPMVLDSGFVGISQLVEIWNKLQILTQSPQM